ncbi:hypothetical protein ACLX1H_007990 [Fusarium chlamydosporum]
MVKLMSLVTILVTAAVGAEATGVYQCLFPDGSHCCAFVSVRGPAISGTQACANAARQTDSKRCNAGGKWSKVSSWNANFRTGCLAQPNLEGF